jgi:hypothetical protein
LKQLQGTQQAVSGRRNIKYTKATVHDSHESDGLAPKRSSIKAHSAEQPSLFGMRALQTAFILHRNADDITKEQAKINDGKRVTGKISKQILDQHKYRVQGSIRD